MFDSIADSKLDCALPQKFRKRRGKGRSLKNRKKPTDRDAYGGDLMTTRFGRREGGRPISTKETMHLVLRSSKAKGDWSFRRPRNAHKIESILARFSVAYGMRILKLANVGNHLHLHVKVSHRQTYAPFIRAVTAAIAMHVTGRNRWSVKSAPSNSAEGSNARFWDRRPFTRIVRSFQAYKNLSTYVRINQLEGAGIDRKFARKLMISERKAQERD